MKKLRQQHRKEEDEEKNENCVRRGEWKTTDWLWVHCTRPKKFSHAKCIYYERHSRRFLYEMEWNGMNERRTALWTIWKWKINKRREAQRERVWERGKEVAEARWKIGWMKKYYEYSEGIVRWKDIRHKNGNQNGTIESICVMIYALSVIKKSPICAPY